MDKDKDNRIRITGKIEFRFRCDIEFGDSPALVIIIAPDGIVYNNLLKGDFLC